MIARPTSTPRKHGVARDSAPQTHQQPAACPCCGRPFPVSTLTIEPETGCVALAGRSARLSPRETELVSLLHSALPASRSEAELQQSLGLSSTVSVRTLIAKTRPRLRQIGVDIANFQNSHYRLEGAGS